MSEVVITGLGARMRTAKNVHELWQNVAFPCVFGPGPKNEPGASLDLVQRSDVVEILGPSRLAEIAAEEALKQSGLWDGRRASGMDPERFGCTVSVSKPVFLGQGSDVQPPETINAWLCQRFTLQGESRNVIAACATGAYAVALGASWIEQGLCDAVLAGSVEPPAHSLIEAGFRRMGVMTSEAAMRPFDRRRSGFVLGEGAGIVVLESRAHAQRRGARVLAELSGWGWGADSHSAVAFNSNGERIADVVRQALRRAGLPAQAVRHVNAHGTATRHNDWIETQALIKAFGRSAGSLMISATKSSTGHLLGAAGSVELILMVRSLIEQFVPPTAHLEVPDPECALDYTPRQGRRARFEHALSLSFGFGGPIGALLASRA